MEYSELKALYINCTLKKSPTLSHTQGLIDLSRRTMESRGVQTNSFRLADFVVPPGMQSDLCLAGPIWLGENSSVMRILMERLYAMSGLLNEQGQYSFYGKVGCTLLSGNEDGVKHAAMGNLYGLQHIGYTIAPQADAGWVGTIGPGLSYLDKGSGGPENDFTNRNTVFMSWNAMHLAALLKKNNFYPPVGNSRRAWDEGDKTGFIPRQSS
ncbi:MAG: flavodoxin [Microbacteriaceae bacterium BACL25 MAG-120322-bin65]|jgi:hypothetical protein|nr:MAG: flavodoxin [Microbacteriaceae bacterium BACL25 MAG-120322-bin65]HAA79141.1 flavodoxin [Microbacteriaceae bacterium]